MQMGTHDLTKPDATTLIAAFRRTVTRLLTQSWPPESPFLQGITMLVRQLMQLERQPGTEVDETLIKSLLPIVDAVERARRQAQEIDPGRVKMFDRTLDEMLRILRVCGVRPDRPLGTTFDPHHHEAVGVRETMMIPGGRVIEIMERGWYVRNQQVRPSKVVVSKQVMPAATPG